MNIIEKMFFLRKAPLLAGLGEQDLLRVADIAEDMTFEPGERLFYQGDPGDSLYIILDGEVSIDVDDVEVNVMGRGQFFGEVTVLANLPRIAGAVAVIDLYVLSIERAPFLRLFQRNRGLRLNVVRELGRRVCEIGRRERQMTAARRERHAPGES
jgi:CRP/FNR family cyclic AMP-dependent transcriptional regulator